jgi:regulator of replication initiation timing
MFNLKSLFFEEDEKEKPVSITVPNTNKDKIEVAAEAVITNSISTTPTQASVGTINNDVLNTLEEAIEKANIDGYDYFEYQQSLQAMKDSGTSFTEPQLFATTFAMAKSMGVTKEVLLSSIDHYVSALEKKKTSFTEFFNSIFVEKVQLPLDKIQKNTESIDNMRQQITELNQKINELLQENFSLQTESTNEKLQLDSTKNAFDYTFNTVVSKLKDDQNKIANYIQG